MTFFITRACPKICWQKRREHAGDTENLRIRRYPQVVCTASSWCTWIRMDGNERCGRSSALTIGQRR